MFLLEFFSQITKLHIVTYSQMVKNLPAMRETGVWSLGLIPGSGRSPGEGKSYPLQYSGPENSMDRPWGHKQSDTTERLSVLLSFLESWLWDSLPHLGIQPSPASTCTPTASPNSQVWIPWVSASTGTWLQQSCGNHEPGASLGASLAARSCS